MSQVCRKYHAALAAICVVFDVNLVFPEAKVPLSINVDIVSLNCRSAVTIGGCAISESFGWSWKSGAVVFGKYCEFGSRRESVPLVGVSKEYPT